LSDSKVVLGVGDPTRRAHLAEVLASLGYEVNSAEEPAELLDLVPEPRMALVDHAFVARAGEGWWAQLRRSLPRASVVVLPEPAPAASNGAARPGAHANGNGAVAELTRAIEPLLGAAFAAPRGARRARAQGPLDPFVGESNAIRRLAAQARQALHSESPVLIEGETGTGKGVLATWLHRHGSRASSPFVDLNCAGFSRELMDAELFGHEKGAFTGAVSAKPGLLEVADGGTLFLDEIGDMDGGIQAKLLKVIEEHRYRRVGGTRERHSDVRVLVATHHHLPDRVREGHFRDDLYYRVSVLPLRVPALRERTCDILPLARCILASLIRDGGADAPRLSAEAEHALVRYPWPGNLRELRNALERALLACRCGPIERRHLGLDLEPSLVTLAGPAIEGRTFAELERAYIERVLSEERQHVERAAHRLGIPRSTFYQKLRALGIRKQNGALAALSSQNGH